MIDDKDLIDKLLGYPEIDVCADAADEILGLRSACARLRADREKLRAELAAAEQRNADFFAAQKTVDTALRTEIDLACRERDEARAELAAERERAQLAIDEAEARRDERDKLREALERAERKLTAYVGVCKDDKELTDAVLPMARAVLKETGWRG
jgi:chromosome segregation ATPase